MSDARQSGDGDPVKPREKPAIGHRGRVLWLHCGVMLLLAGLVFGLYGDNLDGYWRGDDTYILLHALQHSMPEIFFSPAAWQQLSASNLTPLLSLSYYLDYWLAGLDPLSFYVHQLLVIVLIGFMTYILLAHFANRWLAVGGAMLVLLGTPIANVSALLMTRHYVEGLLLSLVCLHFYVQARRGAGHGYFWLALVCYLFAMTAKEIYVPLGLLLVVDVARRRNESWLMHLLALVIVITGYVIWRSYMLPQLSGGYSASADFITGSYMGQMFATFLSLPAIVFGDYALILCLLLLFAFLALAWIDTEACMAMLSAGGLIMAPLIPLVTFPGIQNPDRYLLLPWYGFAFALVYVIGRVQKHFSEHMPRRWLPSLALVMVAFLIGLMLDHQKDYRQFLQAFNSKADAQLRFLWENNEDVAFVPDRNLVDNFLLVQTSRELKRYVDDQASSPIAIVDEIFLDDGQRIYEYSDDCSCMRDVSAGVPQRMAGWRERLRDAAPLHLLMTNADGLVSWELGPYTDGSYHLVSETMGDQTLRIQQNDLRTNFRTEIPFYLKYISPEGWISYSPPLLLRPDGMPLIWARE